METTILQFFEKQAKWKERKRQIMEIKQSEFKQLTTQQFDSEGEKNSLCASIARRQTILKIGVGSRRCNVEIAISLDITKSTTKTEKKR